MILAMARLFMSQEQMDRWASEGKVKLEDDIMHLPALNRSFRLQPAVLFDKLVGGEDQEGLIGRVKTLDQLGGMGGEHYGNSVILGDVGYECVEGFIGLPVEAGAMGGSGLLRLGG